MDGKKEGCIKPRAARSWAIVGCLRSSGTVELWPFGLCGLGRTSH